MLMNTSVDTAYISLMLYFRISPGGASVYSYIKLGLS